MESALSVHHEALLRLCNQFIVWCVQLTGPNNTFFLMKKN